jgi:predicted N-acyltransferase
LSALIQGAVQLGRNNNLSSLHVTFCSEQERDLGVSLGLMPRTTQQFHWFNKGYRSFDDFLQTLSSRKRKNIRNERVRAQNFGGSIKTFTGGDLTSEHWDAFWDFYQDTGARKWGTPYLTRRFFDIAQETLREDIVLVLAERNGRYVAGALNFFGANALYGRYWGCIEHHPYLHFELCYYQAIDIAITNDFERVEAGAQGEHKLARGYLPTQTHSLHWVKDKGFENAISCYLDAEREAIEEEIEVMTDFGPFKRVQVEEQE